MDHFSGYLWQGRTEQQIYPQKYKEITYPGVDMKFGEDGECVKSDGEPVMPVMKYLKYDLTSYIKALPC